MDTSTTAPPKRPFSLFLILLNIIPLIGVVFLEWSAVDIFILYWLETLIAGIYLIPRIWLSEGAAGRRINLIIYCAISYVVTMTFWVVTIVMIYTGYKMRDPSLEISFALSHWLTPTLIWAAAIFFAGHLFLLFRDWVKSEFKSRPIGYDILSTMGRLFVIQGVVSGASYMIVANDLPVFSTLILVIGKILLDLVLFVSVFVWTRHKRSSFTA